MNALPLIARQDCTWCGLTTCLTSFLAENRRQEQSSDRYNDPKTWQQDGRDGTSASPQSTAAKLRIHYEPEPQPKQRRLPYFLTVRMLMYMKRRVHNSTATTLL